jgi:hypothetical protein
MAGLEVRISRSSEGRCDCKFPKFPVGFAIPEERRWKHTRGEVGPAALFVLAMLVTMPFHSTLSNNSTSQA